MSETITATNGVQLPLDALEQTIAYTGDFPLTITVEYTDGLSPASVIDYVQTFTNNGTKVTVISQWEPQN